MTSVDRIQGLSGSLAVKTPCRVATTANITLSGEQTIDAVAVVDGDRVLVKNQTDTTENGIYNVSTGHWTRALDFDGANDFVQSTAIVVQQGTAYANTMWKVTTASPVIGGPLVFDQLVPGDASAVEFVQAGSGAATRTVQTKLREIFSVTDFGTTGDGVADDTAEVTAAIAAADAFLEVPEGEYLTTLAASAVTKTLHGLGTVILTGGQRLPNTYSYTAAAPATWNTPGDPALAFAGESKSPYRYQAYIAGAATASQPTTGYFHSYNLAQVSNHLYNASGYNHSTSDTTGRTMIPQQLNYLIHAGQGDVCTYYGSGYVSNPTPLRSSHWLADPAHTVIAGGAEATTDSVNLVGAEVQAVDNGHEATMSGYTSHIYRTVTPSPNTKEYVCVNFGATSNGAEDIDAFYYGAGKTRIGIDMTAADISEGVITLKADQFIYGNCTNTSTTSTPEGTVLGDSYAGYQAASSAWICVNGAASWRLHSYGFVLPTVPLYTQAGRVKGTRVVTAAGAVTVTAADEVVIVNKTVGAATAASLFATPASGSEITIKDGKGDANVNNITITPAAGTIDGAATAVINTAYGSKRLIYNGTQWNII